MTGVNDRRREIDVLVDMLASTPFPRALNNARATLDSLGTPPAADIDSEKLEIGGVACQLLAAPGADPKRLVVYLHGGGYALGSLDSHAGLASEIGRAAGCRVLQVDYRLAPEHSFPAPIDDTTAVYRGLLENAHSAESIVLAGDSAGGGLVLASILAMKEALLPLPAAAVCLSPWVDMGFSGESVESCRDLDPIIEIEAISAMVNAYMAGQDPLQAKASPLYTDLEDFPPLLIHVGEREILLSDAERLAENAQAANLELVYEKWPDMIHVWHLFYPQLTEARTAIAGIGDFIRSKT